MYEWLNTYARLDERRTLIRYEINRCEAEYKRWKTFGPLQGDLAQKSDTLTALAKQDDLRTIIAAYNDELEQIDKDIQELEKVVDSFKGLDHKILKLKYMDKMTLNDIAEILNYSYQHIKNKHSIIMKMIEYKQKGTF